MAGPERFGYTLARMKLRVLLAPEAVADYAALRAFDRSLVRHALEELAKNPGHIGRRGRIKRLRGLQRPQYRLRIREIRVFYDVAGSTIQVLAIVPKEEAQSWLDREGKKS
jgi:mRNA-degrading endonuclease RelE of RelBE toxin-antitoxin system